MLKNTQILIVLLLFSYQAIGNDDGASRTLNKVDTENNKLAEFMKERRSRLEKEIREMEKRKILEHRHVEHGDPCKIESSLPVCGMDI